MGVINWMYKRKLASNILKLSIAAKSIEEENRAMVKLKIGYHQLLTKEETAEEAKRVMIAGIEWQKETFESLSTASYVIENAARDIAFDERTNPLRQKIVDARKIVDALATSYDEQLRILRSIVPAEQKKQQLREPINEELAIYKQYQQMKKGLPLETIAHLEVEWKQFQATKPQSDAPFYRKSIYLPAFFGAIIFTLLTLNISDPEVRQKLNGPASLFFIGGLGYAIRKMMIEFEKMLKEARIIKASI